MDGPASSFNGNSQRRKLVKKPPSHTYTRSSSGLSDSQSLGSRRSSQSLRRAPSAPPVRSSITNASNNSSPRHPTVSQWPSNASPVAAQGDFLAPSNVTNGPGFTGNTSNPAASNLPLAHRPNRLSDSHNLRHSREPSDDLLGAPFDGAAILSRIESTKYTSPRESTQRSPLSPALAKPIAGTRIVSPALRASQSFSNMEPAITEKIHGGRVPEGAIAASKRYSDDGKESKPPMLRKKSGFSGFVTSLVGSQKKPTISAPENPVHVTHVGYDSATGQFTVRSTSTLPAL
jgi:p21-activated kinase 1